MRRNNAGLNVNGEFSQYGDFFRKIWGDKKPLAKLFRTDKRGYIYDTGTNKILGCDHFVYELLQNLFSMGTLDALQSFLEKYGDDKFLHAASSIKATVENHNILRLTRAEEFMVTSDKCNLDEMIQGYRKLLVLETTDRCNLRCGYCVYDPNNKDNRSHGKNDMSLDVAKKAIEHFRDHSYKEDRVGITFYGGEPLLVFPFLEHCVKYAVPLFIDKKLDLSITTNGTLITPKIAKFLQQNNFLVLVSIDGPESVHNQYRKDKDDNGSFKNSLRGLKYLVDAYGDMAEDRLRLSMVYTPPYSSKRLDAIAGLWDEHEWLPKKMNVRIAYPTEGSMPLKYYENNPPEDKPMFEWAFEIFRKKYNKKGFSNPIADSIIESALGDYMQRPIFNVPNKRINMNGCCVPGVSRLFVTVDGRYLLCERVPSNTPSFGDVHSDIDIDTVKTEFVNRFVDISFPDCSCCWAARLCDSCYMEAFNDGAMSSKSKFKNCDSFKNGKEQYLEYCCTLLEDNPMGLDYLLERKNN
jgi:uncharacterized protein